MVPEHRKGHAMLISTILEEKGHEVATLRPEQSVRTAVALLAERRIGAVVIVEKDRVAGIFTERDLVQHLARRGAPALELSLRDCMTAPVITCRPTDRIDQVMALMTERHIRHMPAMEGERLCGMISIRDLGRKRIAEKEVEAAILLDISRMRG